MCISSMQSICASLLPWSLYWTESLYILVSRSRRPAMMVSSSFLEKLTVIISVTLYDSTGGNSGRADGETVADDEIAVLLGDEGLDLTTLELRGLAPPGVQVFHEADHIAGGEFVSEHIIDFRR